MTSIGWFLPIFYVLAGQQCRVPKQNCSEYVRIRSLSFLSCVYNSFSRQGAQDPTQALTIIREVPCEKGQWPLKHITDPYFQLFAFLVFMMAHCPERWFWNFAETWETLGGSEARDEVGHAGAGSPGQDMNIHREPALVALDVYFLPLSPEQPREGIIIYLLRVYSGPFKIITPAHCICVLEVRCQGLSILPKVTQLRRGGIRI